MIISSQGFGHFTDNINNQDFGIETPRMLLILDGCSGGKYSEVGTRIFAQLFSRKEECDSVEKFEDNVKDVFNSLIEYMKAAYPESKDLEEHFIMENLLFTIIACFETDNEYIVKLFGDGYIVSENQNGATSYLRFSYGKCPPYYAYKFCQFPGSEEYKEYGIKTFTFNKEIFPKIAIATDGIMPIARGDVKGLDKAILDGNEMVISLGISNNRQLFYDDITIATFGGKY